MFLQESFIFGWSPFLLLFLLHFVSGTTPYIANVFKICDSVSYLLFHANVFDTVTVRSPLDCGQICSRTSTCSGYKLHSINMTCSLRSLLTRQPSGVETARPQLITYTKTEIPSSSNSENAMACKTAGKWENVAGLCKQFKVCNPKTDVNYCIPCGNGTRFNTTIFLTPAISSRFRVDIIGIKEVILSAKFIVKRGIVILNSYHQGSWRHGPPFFGQRFACKLTLSKECRLDIKITPEGAMVMVDDICRGTYSCRTTDLQETCIKFYNANPHVYVHLIAFDSSDIFL